MSMQDPIADMLTRVRNAQAVSKQTVSMPSSKQKVAIVKVMIDEGYITNYEITEQDGRSILIITLKYHNNAPVISAVKRISRPGLRVYKQYKDLPKVVGGLGTAIVSTSKGVMSDSAARLAKMGGEVLCYIW